MVTLIEPIQQQDTASLVVNNLWKVHDRRSIVQGISFTLNPGEIIGLLGPNGTGKTTTVGMLYGSVTPSQGSVQLGGVPVQGAGHLARSKMGVVTQENNLDPDFSVLQNLMYFAHHYHIVGQAARQLATDLLERVGLQDYANHFVEELSGGMKRRLVLARALINRPSIILLDEPTTGLDPDARQDFWKLILELKQQGCGVLLTTHYMDEAQRLCDRLLLLQEGAVLAEGTPDELIERMVGAEVSEVAGIPRANLEALIAPFDTWCRPLGDGFVLPLPKRDAEVLWHRLAMVRPQRLVRRPANLDDVFLYLTSVR